MPELDEYERARTKLNLIPLNVYELPNLTGYAHHYGPPFGGNPLDLGLGEVFKNAPNEFKSARDDLKSARDKWFEVMDKAFGVLSKPWTNRTGDYSSNIPGLKTREEGVSKLSPSGSMGEPPTPVVTPPTTPPVTPPVVPAVRPPRDPLLMAAGPVNKPVNLNPVNNVATAPAEVMTNPAATVAPTAPARVPWTGPNMVKGVIDRRVPMEAPAVEPAPNPATGGGENPATSGGMNPLALALGLIQAGGLIAPEGSPVRNLSAGLSQMLTGPVEAIRINKANPNLNLNPWDYVGAAPGVTASEAMASSKLANEVARTNIAKANSESQAKYYDALIKKFDSEMTDEEKMYAKAHYDYLLDVLKNEGELSKAKQIEAIKHANKLNEMRIKKALGLGVGKESNRMLSAAQMSKIDEYTYQLYKEDIDAALAADPANKDFKPVKDIFGNTDYSEIFNRINPASPLGQRVNQSRMTLARYWRDRGYPFASLEPNTNEAPVAGNPNPNVNKPLTLEDINKQLGELQ